VPIAVMTIAKPVLARVVASEEPADILKSQHPSFARVRATDWSMSLRRTRWSTSARRYNKGTTLWRVFSRLRLAATIGTDHIGQSLVSVVICRRPQKD
jgi:hypothetical protein